MVVDRLNKPMEINYVIEMSGVQFGLKTCVISKSNVHSAPVRFEFTSMISDQNCMTRSSIATLLDP